MSIDTPTRSFKHKENVENLCLRISKHPEIQSAIINDFGFFDNFEIHIVPEEHNRSSTNRIKKIVKKELKDKSLAHTGAHLREYFSPERKQKTIHGIRKIVYDRNYWSFDIDFQSFDLNANRFN